MALVATILAAVAPFSPVYAYQQRIAVLIGFKQYEGGQGKGIFRDLPFTTNDLEAVGKALSEIGFYPIYIYSDADAPTQSNFEYRSPLPSGSTTSKVRTEDLRRIFSHALQNLNEAQDTLLLFYFTGHGGTFKGEDRVLALPDSTTSNTGSFSRVQDLLEDMDSEAKNVDKILVVDACADNLMIGRPGGITRRSELLPVHLFSSTVGEMSYFDRDLKMSVFTYYFVNALKRADSLGFGDRDGDIETREIQYFVERYVPEHAGKERKKNLPDSKAYNQNPWGSGKKSLTLGQSRLNKLSPSKGAGESAPDWEARIQGYLKVFYGR